MTGLGDDFWYTLTLREFQLLIYAENAENLGEEGGTVLSNTPGISGSTYAMKLKPTPGMALDKRS